MSRLEDRLRIEPDGTITVCSGKVELGQDIRTAFARLVAAGLRVPVASVRVVLGDTAASPPDMGTFGSLSVRTDGALLARAAIYARGCLIDRAARRWGVAPETLASEAGSVVAADGRHASYAELVARAPLAGEIPDRLPLAPPAAEPERADQRDGRRALVTGAARFAADLRVPGMLAGHVLHAPSFGASLRSLDDAAARALPGVVAVIRDGDFVGVVAERPAQARAAVGALVAEWAGPAASARPERRITLRDDPVAHALASAGVALDARYELPHVANAPLGTTTALADVQRDRAEIHAATQRPFGVRDDVARLLGIAANRVRVIAEPAAGSFGRNNNCDAALEAARLSRAAGRPVLVTWSRADELRAAPCRPRLSARIRAGLDAAGRLIAWSSDIATNPHVYFGDLMQLPDALVAMTCARNAVPPYRLGAAHVEVRIAPAEIRTAALRSLSAAPNVFAIESAIDELAGLAAIDPLELRLRNTDDPRLQRVLTCVAERSGWARRPRGSGLGLACAIYNDTYVAEVAEVAIARDHPRVVRAWCALDCGMLVDPDGARNQIEGGIVHAISWALIEELRHEGGRVLARSWQDYPIARFHDAPVAIDVAFTDDGRTAPTGVGEPPAVPFGAAIANAVSAACGVRVRSQPIRSLRSPP
ncbi:MAG TPA: molybdopterin cofactor-binding domain-containing protein [Kofleriaceae bacterium]|nr:molybdopterin cofactor-binding domain-containing protein [Kofleriaceae bacterium]